MLRHKPPITQNQIPKVRDICQALGFGGDHDRSEHELKDSTQSWRKQYVTDDGTRGKDLTEWRSSKMQSDLLCMTRDFLELGGYGICHWPAKGKANPRTVPEYPIDQQKITDLLCQLFWQQNVNQAHNAKHPDRGRRVRESIESDRSDHSSGTLISPSIGYPVAAASRSTASAVPKWNPYKKLQSLHPSVKVISGEQRYNNAPVQSSDSSYVPSTFPNSNSTLDGSPAPETQPEAQEDIFDFGGDDTNIRRQEKTPKSLVVKLRFKQARENKAPTANMKAASSEPRTTPTKSWPQQQNTTPDSKSPSAQAASRKSSAESRQKRKDVDGDDEDAEYTPGRRSKRRRPASDDEPSLAKSRPTRRAPSPVQDNEESPIVRTVERRGDALPTRSKERSSDESGKAPTIAEPIAFLPDRRPSSPTDNDDTNHLGNEGVNYMNTLEKAPEYNPRQNSYDVDRDQPDKRILPSFPTMTRIASPIHKTNAPVANNAPDRKSQAAARQPSQPPAAQSNSKPEIRYFLINRIPLLSQRHWPEGSLGDKSITDMFNDVEYFTSKKNIKRIVFKLTTSRKEAIFTIPRGGLNTYETMKKKFAADINADLARGNTEFDIELEPDPKLDVVEPEIEANDAGPRFSF